MMEGNMAALLEHSRRWWAGQFRPSRQSWRNLCPHAGRDGRYYGGERHGGVGGRRSNGRYWLESGGPEISAIDTAAERVTRRVPRGPMGLGRVQTTFRARTAVSTTRFCLTEREWTLGDCPNGL